MIIYGLNKILTKDETLVTGTIAAKGNPKQEFKEKLKDN